jgi:nucleotide-binding universal stress UspA family protein
MQTRVVVPLDGSEFAQGALPMALALARRGGAILELVHAVDPLPGDMSTFDARFESDERDRLHTALVALAAKLSAETGTEVAARIIEGDVVVSLLRYIHETRASLVVMTTHGRSGLGRTWPGSVTDGLLRGSEAPVLFMPSGRETPREPGEPLFERVVLPLDDSEISEEIFLHALSLATPRQTTLLLLHVLDPGAVQIARAVAETAQDPLHHDTLIHEEYVAAADRLSRLAAELRDNCVEVTTEVVIASSPARCIVTYAEDHDVDLIALCTNTHHGLGQSALGATADHVVRAARVPVLAHRPVARRLGD